MGSVYSCAHICSVYVVVKGQRHDLFVLRGLILNDVEDKDHIFQKLS